MMAHTYRTLWGDVRISEREYRILDMAADIRARGGEGDGRWSDALAKADAIVAACGRFAEWKFAH